MSAGRELVATLTAESLPPRGQAMAVDTLWEGHTLPMVLLRWTQGRVCAYLNLCPHMGVRLNRSGSALFDRGRRHLLCTTHGALFRPGDGLCVSGPCGGDHLDALEAVEVFGQVQVFLPPALADQLRRQRGLITALESPTTAPDAPGPSAPGGSTRE